MCAPKYPLVYISQKKTEKQEKYTCPSSYQKCKDTITKEQDKNKDCKKQWEDDIESKNALFRHCEEKGESSWNEERNPPGGRSNPVFQSFLSFWGTKNLLVLALQSRFLLASEWQNRRLRLWLFFLTPPHRPPCRKPCHQDNCQQDDKSSWQWRPKELKFTCFWYTL